MAALFQVVPETKIIYLQFFGAHMNTQFLVPFTVQDIVVAFYQVNIQERKIFAPFAEQVQLFIFPAMK
jgi:hypothetical protein